MSAIPKASNGFIITLNQMGYMTDHLDPYSIDFIDWSLKSEGPTLDVGAAYGIATLPLVEKLNEIWVNDLDESHLKLIVEQIKQPELKKSYGFCLEIFVLLTSLQIISPLFWRLGCYIFFQVKILI